MSATGQRTGRWSPGDVVVLRELWNGRIWSARPSIVVRDDADVRMFFTPVGVTMFLPAAADGSERRLPHEPWTLRPRRWDAWHVLSFSWPSERYAVLAMWDPAWTFAMWYVNVEDPLRPTPIGFDTTELLLDVVVDPDLRSWRWKDEEELEEAVALGLFTPEDAAAFREAAERGRRRVTDRRPPFDRDWSSWRPDPSWPLPELSGGWDLTAG